MIDRSSLFKAPLPRATQQPSPLLVNPEAAASIEVVQELLKPLVEDLAEPERSLAQSGCVLSKLNASVTS
jgi:hypothetical protein